MLDELEIKLDASSIEKMMKQIGNAHGIFLGKDDPLIILVTANNVLAQISRKHQEAMLGEFRSEMEALKARCNQDMLSAANNTLSAIAEQAENIVNLTLEESKKALSQVVEQSMHAKQHAMSRRSELLLKEARQTAYFSLAASVVAALAALTALWVAL